MAGALQPILTKSGRADRFSLGVHRRIGHE
jgi:hypothetical protein